MKRKLPHQSDRLFFTDGGLETTLIFLDGYELPGFSAIHMLKDEASRQHLKQYFEQFVQVAKQSEAGFLFESPTWRSSDGWFQEIECEQGELAELDEAAIKLLAEIREEHETPESPMVISGCIGPQGDGYNPETMLSVEEARQYHQSQVERLVAAGADCISALTMTYVEEGAGIAEAARQAGVPSVVSFTVETDGKLITGQSIQEAIEKVDELTDQAPAYYMINCAHPTHFSEQLEEGATWTSRIAGIRANASTCSHEELDNATELDCGHPEQLAVEYAELLRRFPHIKLVGGCCGTDIRHIQAIATTIQQSNAPAAA